MLHGYIYLCVCIGLPVVPEDMAVVEMVIVQMGTQSTAALVIKNGNAHTHREGESQPGRQGDSQTYRQTERWEEREREREREHREMYTRG